MVIVEHHHDIFGILEKAADRFRSSLSHFRPWHGQEGITEANLVFQFATAFLETNRDGFAFVEVPFAAREGGRTNNRLDAYLVSGHVGYLLECKQLWNPTQAAEIASDIARMGPHLIAELTKRHSATPPQRFYGLVLAETWNAETVHWWCQDAQYPQWLHRWPREGFPAAWHFGSKEVFKASESNQGTLHWLYGLSPDLLETSTSA